MIYLLSILVKIGILNYFLHSHFLSYSQIQEGRRDSEERILRSGTEQPKVQRKRHRITDLPKWAS